MNPRNDEISGNFSKMITYFKKMRNAKKIGGKKAPIIIKTNIYSINKVSQYILPKELCGVGFEYLIIECKNKTEGSLLLLGKIIARSSSDFLGLLSNKLIAKSKSDGDANNLDLIQYSIGKKDPTRHLIVMVKISPSIENMETISAKEEILLQFHKRFRKAMNDIINTANIN